MPLWILLGLTAALALGAGNIPQKIALAELSPFAYGVLVGIVAIVLNLLAMWYYGDSFNFAAKREWGFALMAAIFFIVGSICIGVGFKQSETNVSQFVALFNTNTLVATVLGLIILKEFGKVVVWKILLGAVLVVAGGILVTI